MAGPPLAPPAAAAGAHLRLGRCPLTWERGVGSGSVSKPGNTAIPPRNKQRGARALARRTGGRGRGGERRRRGGGRGAETFMGVWTQEHPNWARTWRRRVHHGERSHICDDRTARTQNNGTARPAGKTTEHWWRGRRLGGSSPHHRDRAWPRRVLCGTTPRKAPESEPSAGPAAPSARPPPPPARGSSTAAPPVRSPRRGAAQAPPRRRAPPTAAASGGRRPASSRARSGRPVRNDVAHKDLVS